MQIIEIIIDWIDRYAPIIVVPIFFFIIIIHLINVI